MAHSKRARYVRPAGPHNELNSEGLTWGEWLAASRPRSSADLGELRKAWRRGEDPTEWAVRRV